MIVGSFISRLFPLTIYLIYNNFKNKNYQNYIFLLVTFITTITIILSGERVSLFNLFLFFLNNINFF